MALKSRTKNILNVVLIFVMAVLMGIYVFPQYFNKAIDKFNDVTGLSVNWKVSEKPFVLGLDLQGGTHLVYEADVSKLAPNQIEESVEGVRDVIERRVNSLGVSEPQVQVNKSNGKWRIIVELAGIKDVNQAIKMIGETPLLEFKEQNTEPPRELTEEEKKELASYNDEAKKRAEAILQEVLKNPQDFEKIAKEKTEVATPNIKTDQDVKIEANIDLGYIGPNSSFYSKLYDLAKKTGENKVANEVVEWNGGYTIIKVLDKKTDKQEFKAAHILICYKGADRCQSDRTKEEALKLAQEIRDKAQVGDAFYRLAKEYSDDPSAKETGGELGWFDENTMVPAFTEAVKNMENNTISDVVETNYGYHIIWKEDSRPITEYHIEYIWIKKKTEQDILPKPEQWKNTELSGKDLKRASITFDPNTNAPQVNLEFTDEGAKLFEKITERNVSKPLAIFLDGKAIIDTNGDGVISDGEVYAPIVNDVIRNGKAVITGRYTLDEAKLLKQRLNSGALPVPIHLVSQETVGATLGQESVQNSLKAGLWGLLIVALFMIIVYRLPGLMAVLALTVYGLIVLSIFKFIPVTLTLAGIAGFILSIGMAVDANVLIFERLREELKLNKPIDLAIEEAFKRAWPSIFDGNMSTLITCFILSWFGTSMIQGFAITLGIGVLASMFSAIVITKVFLKITMVKNSKLQKFLYRA